MNIRDKDRDIYPDQVYLRKGKIAGWYMPIKHPTALDERRCWMYYHEDVVEDLKRQIRELRGDDV